LSHCLELLTKWEWHLSDNETTEDGANGLENGNIENTLNVLLDHVSHHIWVVHH